MWQPGNTAPIEHGAQFVGYGERDGLMLVSRLGDKYYCNEQGGFEPEFEYWLPIPALPEKAGAVAPAP